MDRFEALVRSFPVLDAHCKNSNVPVLPTLREIARRPGSYGQGAVHAAQFCLSVYHGTSAEAKKTGTEFDLYWAWGHWDSAQRAAWKAWAADPWWC